MLVVVCVAVLLCVVLLWVVLLLLLAAVAIGGTSDEPHDQEQLHEQYHIEDVPRCSSNTDG